MYITFVRSGGLSFGEENSPLNLLASSLGRRSQNWVGIGRFGRSSGCGCGLGLNTPRQDRETCLLRHPKGALHMSYCVAQRGGWCNTKVGKD